jgi:hypothetical protein
MLRAADSAPSLVGDMARVWYRAVSVLLIRRRRPIAEPGDADRLGAEEGHAPILDTLEGTAGAGRISAALLELGVDLAGVRQAVIGPGASAGDLDGIDLGRRFGRVVLGSHLVNLPDDDLRAAFVRFAARHIATGGALLLEHHPVDWAETAAATAPTPGADLGMVEVRRHPPFVSAVSTYDAGGRVVRQPFTARVLSNEELAEALTGAGLKVERRLGPTWLEAARPTMGA